MTEPRILGVCARCGASLADLRRPCPTCGAEPSSQSQLPTVVLPSAPASAHTRTTRIGRIDTSSSAHAEFTPGQVLAGRYRIIGLLGRGGMGEVYQADDLELDHPVSIKFLPRALVTVPGALERFRGEVRNARQVAHPNVCRVYDIGEADGRPFLTMEFVDGEDLATLLHRIGSLPGAKANEVAGQLCAGLAAAHDKGVLHRDLKPSNIMIDGEGRVRITDFGLAVRVEDGATEFAGTPAYMAPEQFQGGPVTTRTDLYSLGLILYEVYTGSRPFDATSVTEWQSRHTTSQPAMPPDRKVQVDESVERAILRCLEKDPQRRPASVRQLAAALPGGDPLSAALAAGETPSPEMVAGAGGEGALQRRSAWLLGIALLLAIVGVIALSPYSEDLGLAPMRLGLPTLTDRGAELLDRFGYGRDVVDRASWVDRMYGPLLYIARHRPSTEWRAAWRHIGPPLVVTVRQSPRWMPGGDAGRITGSEPPFDVSDMTMVTVNASGRLVGLRAVPPQVDTTGATGTFRWGALFEAAGLDSAAFHPVRPTWVPPDASTARAEWEGTIPALPGTPLRVMAAAYGSRPTYFDIVGPWSQAARMQRPVVTLTQRIAGVTIGVIIALTSIFSAVLVRRNRTLGRGDARGAVRLGIFLFAASMLAWAGSAHHVPSIQLEFANLVRAASVSLMTVAIAMVLYLAVEPYVRRRMPELLIGWQRVLEGRWRDPRVGRDVLIGGVLGAIGALLLHASNALPTWVPILGQTTVPPQTYLLEGGTSVVATLSYYVSVGLQSGLTLMFVLFVFRMLFRNEWASLIAVMLVFSLVQLGGENVALETPFALLSGMIVALAVGRVGLLGAASFVFFRALLAALPLPLDLTAPYAVTSMVVLAVLVALAAYALRISVGSRPLFGLSIDGDG